MIYLGLGSNQGNRMQNLELAIQKLSDRGFQVDRISPVVESPALLPDEATPSWNKPFLNCVICGNTQWSPAEALDMAKAIEQELGRQPTQRWAPRPMDIDILIWHDQQIKTHKLTIPHGEIENRSFVLTPLLHLSPSLVIPGQQHSVIQLATADKIIPLWMGILNMTPDSFSDGGKWLDQDKDQDKDPDKDRKKDKDNDMLQCHLQALIQNQVSIIDIGAESTRPNAQIVNHEQEWGRLQPALELIKEQPNSLLGPLISVDSRHWKTLQKALEYDVQMINDVTGLQDPNIIALARESQCQVIAMHSVTIPVDPAEKLPTDEKAMPQVSRWLHRQIDQWLDAGLDLDKIIFDPGIGFGKNSLQSLELMKQGHELRESGLRILIGHSRKSFMTHFTDQPFQDRDLETLGMSLSLCEKGVDIIRVHEPLMHMRAYRAWSHIR